MGSIIVNELGRVGKLSNYLHDTPEIMFKNSSHSLCPSVCGGMLRNEEVPLFGALHNSCHFEWCLEYGSWAGEGWKGVLGLACAVYLCKTVVYLLILAI